MMTKMMLLTLCLLAAANAANVTKTQCGCETKDNKCDKFNFNKKADGDGDQLGNNKHCAKHNKDCKAGEPKCMCDTEKFKPGGKCTDFANCAMNCKAEAVKKTTGAVKKTETNKPTPTTKPTTDKIHFVQGEIPFEGIDKAAFDPNSIAVLKQFLAKQAKQICGVQGCKAEDVKFVSITDTTRRAKKKKCVVKFQIKTTSAANAKVGETSLRALFTAAKIVATTAQLRVSAKANNAKGLEKFSITLAKVKILAVSKSVSKAQVAVAGGAVGGAAMAAPTASLVSLAGATLALSL